MVDFRVSVVLPAAGIGSRMGCDIPKQVRKTLSLFIVIVLVLFAVKCGRLTKLS